MILETELAFAPTVPRTLDEMGLPSGLVTDVILRRLYLDGAGSIFGLCNSLKLPHRVVEEVFAHLRQQQLVDVKGLVGHDYSFTLTRAGQRLATDRRRICEYAGPAPVPLRAYEESTRKQAARLCIDRRALRDLFDDLVITDKLLDELGPALVSQKSLFLYGPTGNGKTSVAERLHRVFQDTVLLPYAVEVDGQIVVLYDPVVHQRAGDVPEGIDPRWVMCKRPLIIVGGEMTSGMLELRLDTATQIYAAPIQMKANNGVLVIDDFGRQVISPAKLLNRWILPLDRRVDYLNLRYGVKFQIPFEMMVVFSTNLEPRDLADEAFLRRIHNKIFIEPVRPEVFDMIFERVVQERGIDAETGSAEYLRQLCAAAGSPELRACYPRDICSIIEWIKTFEGRPPEIRRADLERAVDLYFTRAISGRSEESADTDHRR